MHAHATARAAPSQAVRRCCWPTTAAMYPQTEVLGQPAAAVFAVQAPAAVAAWSTGLCDCFDDCGNCLVTCLCPCITFGQIAEIVDQGAMSATVSGTLYALVAAVTACHCLYSCRYRTMLRDQYGLRGSPTQDLCVHCFCESCALCQEYRHLKNQGFDMNKGWKGNRERQWGTTATVPPQMGQGMIR